MRSMAGLPLQYYLDRIPESYRLQKLDDDHRLAAIAENIPIWEDLASHLPNINPTIDIVSIRQDNNNYPGQRCGLLRLWLQRNGDKATYSKLVTAMYSAKLINGIAALLQVLVDNQLAPQQQDEGSTPVWIVPKDMRTRAADDLEVSYFEGRVIYEFDSLVTNAAGILKKKLKMSLKKFISELQARYHDKKIDRKCTFKEVLISSTKNCYDITRLFAILEKYADEETKYMRKRYADVVAGYHKVREIARCLRSRETFKYARLQVVAERNQCITYCTTVVTDQVMSYIEKLWFEISKRCKLPPLKVVLAYAEHGCIHITWIIQTDRVTNEHIRDLLIQHLPRNIPFLREHNIVQVMFNNKKIYHITDGTVDGPDIFEAQCELQAMAQKWRRLGRALRLRPALLNRIKADQPDPRSCLMQALFEWFHKAYNAHCFGQLPWKSLVEAVAHPCGGDSPVVANWIAANYNAKQPLTSSFSSHISISDEIPLGTRATQQPAASSLSSTATADSSVQTALDFLQEGPTAYKNMFNAKFLLKYCAVEVALSSKKCRDTEAHAEVIDTKMQSVKTKFDEPSQRDEQSPRSERSQRGEHIPEAESSQRTSQPSVALAPSDEHTTLDIDDIFEVQSELHDVAHNWKGLGMALKLRRTVLSGIEADLPDSASRLEQVLTEWLQQAFDIERFGPPSWKQLVSAVAHPIGGNNPALAQRIAHRHNVEQRADASATSTVTAASDLAGKQQPKLLPATSSQPAIAMSDEQGTLDIDDFFEIYSELQPVAYKWVYLGLSLGLHKHTLDIIEADYYSTNRRLREVLIRWLRRSYNTERYGPPSWKLLVAAVARCDNHNLAERIAHRHNVPFPPREL